MPPDAELRPNAYEMLLVHPSAPAELVALIYWSLVGGLQQKRAAGERVDDALHQLTRAYQCVADAGRRASYNASIGWVAEPLTTRPLPPHRRSILNRLLRRSPDGSINHYEVMGLHHNAPGEILPHAHRIMRDQYLRLRLSRRQDQLLEALQQAYDTLRSPESRARYDDDIVAAMRVVAAVPSPAVPSPAVPFEAPSEPLPSARAAVEREGRAHSPGLAAKDDAPQSALAAPAPSGTTTARGPGALATGARRVLRVARWSASATGAAARLAYRVTCRVISSARTVVRRSRARFSTGPAVEQPGAPVPALPTTNRVKRASSDVEDRFLGRVATSVRESESHLQPAAQDRETEDPL